jgi:hypothetical protein
MRIRSVCVCLCVCVCERIYVAQADLELTILLPQLPKCQD